MSDQQDDKKWHLDRRVPLALIVTIGLQTGAGIWWVSSLSERVNTLERDGSRSVTHVERIVKLETTMEVIVRGVERIERALVK